MQKTVIKTEKAPSSALYSQGILAGNFLFTAGQLPLKDGVLVSEIKAATAQALDNVIAIVEAGGSSLAQVVKVVVYLADIGDYDAMNEVYLSYFPSEPPARACFQAAKLPKDAVVEIEAIAIKG